MSASERLERLAAQHVRVIPIFRKMGSKQLAGADAFARARDVEAVMDALPELIAVVKAAEDLRKADPPGSGPYAYTPQQELIDVHQALSVLDSRLSK